MCGIIGYIGKKPALPILLDGLKRLEYRGYDSAGIAVQHGSLTQSIKVAGKVQHLREKSAHQQLDGTCGIGHTRWATHGEPNEVNAHPHTDCAQTVWLVHNGIIENFSSLKNQLIKEGHRFASETDTEVMAHLIERFHQTLPLELAVTRALRLVKGAYSFVVISAKEPDTIIAAKLSSPLRLGIGIDEFFLASDLAAILDHTKQVITLEDGELATITRSTYTIRTLQGGNLKEKPIEEIDWDISPSEKTGYKHFMLKEIFEEPEVVRNAIRGRINFDQGEAILGGLSVVDEQLQKIEHLHIVGCGSAAFAAMIGQSFIESIGNISASVEVASEFRYREHIFDPEKTALLAISQSGETADTIACVQEAKRKKMLTLGVVNVVGSTIAHQTDAGVYNHAGPEIGVASTKVFISQLTVLALIAIKFGRQRNLSLGQAQIILKELMHLPEKIENILRQKPFIRSIAMKYHHFEHFAFLGRKYNVATAMEGALKLKEISYIHAESYPAGELKHGAIALIDAQFPSLFIALQDSVYEKNASNIQEIKARKGRVIAIATEGDTRISALVDDVIFLPKTLEILTPILATVPLHLFAYEVASLRGCDIDQPRNLAKSVTVE